MFTTYFLYLTAFWMILYCRNIQIHWKLLKRKKCNTVHSVFYCNTYCNGVMEHVPYISNKFCDKMYCFFLLCKLGFWTILLASMYIGAYMLNHALTANVDTEYLWKLSQYSLSKKLCSYACHSTQSILNFNIIKPSKSTFYLYDPFCIFNVYMFAAMKVS